MDDLDTAFPIFPDCLRPRELDDGPNGLV